MNYLVFIKGQNAASLGSFITSPSLDGPSGTIRADLNLADGWHQGPAPKRHFPRRRKGRHSCFQSICCV